MHRPTTFSSNAFTRCMMRENSVDRSAIRVHAHGTVQGVGFRPFVYRLARLHGLCGWVRNSLEGVELHLEGSRAALTACLGDLQELKPPGASISGFETADVEPGGYPDFTITSSDGGLRRTSEITPDLSICSDCARELADPSDRRFGYVYVNCTHCGPRFSILNSLPYDRPNTTMRPWPMCPECEAEYLDPSNRRFHAQPTACPSCGPNYMLHRDGSTPSRGAEAVAAAASLLREGFLLAVKGLGGYHLACDAMNESAVRTLRTRKYRKEKPFALMVRDLDRARDVAAISPEEAELLSSPARPIVLLVRREDGERLPEEIAPGIREYGLMLPYTPLQMLLFDAGAPPILVMTSANRSSEPIAFRDEEAIERLSGLADAFLVGERAIARRVEDSVVRRGPVMLRRSRGYAPAFVARLPCDSPVLAVGADLKNTVTLVVDGEACVGPHIGDLHDYDAFTAFQECVEDMLRMYGLRVGDCRVMHDAHPEYASTHHALSLAGEHVPVQHHRAHVASVLAERGAWDRRVVGFAFDGTGYGDDGTIWGGEVFAGSVSEGFERVAHLRQALLPGGDAAAKYPVQAAAGFVFGMRDVPDLREAPFHFPDSYGVALDLCRTGTRVFPTTSAGRLFDAAAALLGFTRGTTFEGQAAIWLEQTAWESPHAEPYPFSDLDYAQLLEHLIRDCIKGRPPAEIAGAFHSGIAQGIASTARALCRDHGCDTIVLSGGVFQNTLLLEQVQKLLHVANLHVLTNAAVPANDGGISLGQAALGAFTAPGGRSA